MTTANPAVYDHGITQGASDALDVQTLWIFAAVRALNQPQPSNLAAGTAVFAANCASCHGKDGKGATKAGRMAGVKDFTDAAYQKGKTVSLIALLLALALIPAGLLLERRRRVV